MEVSLLHPLKQLLPKVFPPGAVNVTEGKFVHPLKQLFPNEVVALLRLRAVNPLHLMKILSPSAVNELDVVICVIAVHDSKHCLLIVFSDGSSVKLRCDPRLVTPPVVPLLIFIVLRLVQLMKDVSPRLRNPTGNSTDVSDPHP